MKFTRIALADHAKDVMQVGVTDVTQKQAFLTLRMRFAAIFVSPPIL
jgi:hypothetical protein